MDISYSIPDVAFMGGGSFTPVNSETSAFFARLGTQPSKGRAQLYDALITSLKSGGVWTRLDILYIFAAEQQATALTNLVSSSFNASQVNTIDFLANQGVASNGSNSYLTTNFSPSTQGITYTATDAHVSLWDLTSRAAASFRACGLLQGGVSEILIAPHFTGPNTYIRANDTLTSLADTVSTGFFLGSRVVTPNILYYQNTTSLGNNTGVSGGIPTGTVFVCAESNAGTPIGFTTDRLATFSMGASLSAGQETAFYNALHTYLQAVAGIA